VAVGMSWGRRTYIKRAAALFQNFHSSPAQGERWNISLSLSHVTLLIQAPPPSLLFFFTVSILIPHCRECKGFFLFLVPSLQSKSTHNV
jgi:hypothetical protein